MNREILFRGKRTDNGEWIEGYYVPCSFGSWPCRPAIVNKADIENGEWHYEEVDPSTVCQYTGLTDRNGKKIFEGDILRQKTTDKFKQYNDFEWERYGIVRFGEHDFRPDYAGYSTICFYVESIKSVAINPLNHAIGGMSNGINQYYALDENYPYEVIGNIFDHPELLEENNT